MCVAVLVVDVFSLSVSNMNNAEEKQEETISWKDLIPEDQRQSPEFSEESLAMIEDSSNATAGCMSDTTPCLSASSRNPRSCNHCCSKHMGNHPKFSAQEHDPTKLYCGWYGTGVKNGVVCWGDGTRCMAGSTCNLCCAGTMEHWWTRGMTSCGHEPCWGRGTRCVGGSSCGRCCNRSPPQWSWQHFGHFCKWYLKRRFLVTLWKGILVPLYIFVCFYFSCCVVLAVVYCCDLTGFCFFGQIWAKAPYVLLQVMIYFRVYFRTMKNYRGKVRQVLYDLFQLT